ncbi:MAG: HAMP domain-containing histidine kinase, partial [Candidatus Melainabacteria bacterium]|nr:HAMP domain-containing histidine kinase [Candidatus Melainabacteria bacterium]
ASLRLMEGGLVGNLPEKAKGMVTIGRDSCDRLIRLIGDLLDLSKFEAGKMPLALKAVQAKSLVSRAASECEGTAANAQVKLLEECDEDCLILADGDRILQVLVNLLSNAFKFSPEGSTVTIRARQFGENRMRFSVKDQGPGIAKNDLEKLFQKFQQLHNSANAEGTGLGLAICKAIAGQHMGDMGVSSVLGEGSEFWLELPINYQHEKVSSTSKDLQAANS